jgi:hypothetical protein
MSETHEALADLFEGPVPPGLASLPDRELVILVDAIAAAQRHQRDALAAAVDAGLAMVPRVLRGTVRKVLFG